MNVLPFLFLGGLAYILFRDGKNLADQLEYSLSDLTIDHEQTNMSTLVANVTIAIYNPTKTGFTFTGVEAGAYYKQTRVAKIFWQQRVTVLPNKTTYVTIPIRMQISTLATGLTSGVLEYIQNSTKPSIEINGKILFALGSLNINKTIGFK